MITHVFDPSDKAPPVSQFGAQNFGSVDNLQLWFHFQEQVGSHLSYYGCQPLMLHSAQWLSTNGYPPPGGYTSQQQQVVVQTPMPDRGMVGLTAPHAAVPQVRRDLGVQLGQLPTIPDAPMEHLPTTSAAGPTTAAPAAASMPAAPATPFDAPSCGYTPFDPPGAPALGTPLHVAPTQLGYAHGQTQLKSVNGWDLCDIKMYGKLTTFLKPGLANSLRQHMQLHHPENARSFHSAWQFLVDRFSLTNGAEQHADKLVAAQSKLRIKRGDIYTFHGDFFEKSLLIQRLTCNKTVLGERERYVNCILASNDQYWTAFINQMARFTDTPVLALKEQAERLHRDRFVGSAMSGGLSLTATARDLKPHS